MEQISVVVVAAGVLSAFSAAGGPAADSRDVDADRVYFTRLDMTDGSIVDFSDVGAFSDLEGFEQTGDGGVFLAGTVASGGMVRRVAAHGDLVWTRTFPGGFPTRLAADTATSAPILFVAGTAADADFGDGLVVNGVTAGTTFILELGFDGENQAVRWLDHALPVSIAARDRRARVLVEAGGVLELRSTTVDAGDGAWVAMDASAMRAIAAP